MTRSQRLHSGTVVNFVLGATSPKSRETVEEARLFDHALDREIDKLEEALAPLALAGSAIAPSEVLWKRIEAAIDTDAVALDHRHIVLFRDGDWQPLVPGIDSKPLWNARTWLIRCAPGAEMPPHEHESDEHLLVMAGDLIIGDRTFLIGDCIHSPAGQDQFPHTTRGGCLLLRQLAG